MTTTDSRAERRRVAQDALAQIRRLRRQEDLPDLEAARRTAAGRAAPESESREAGPTPRR
jgi:hypothetical protein